MDPSILSASLPGLLLAALLLCALFIIPLGLPGLWLMLGGAVLHSTLVESSGIGITTLVICTTLIVVAELLEYTMSASYTRKYGGSRRASWGAMIGGFLGAFMGIPLPIVGPMVGAFIGAFAGAFVGELSVGRGERGNPGRAATGAIIGRAIATAIKTAVGVVVAVTILLRAFA